jgi:hydrogenase maturation factor HypE
MTKRKAVHHGDTAGMTNGNPCGTMKDKSFYHGEKTRPVFL